jgi:hypothetical protein
MIDLKTLMDMWKGKPVNYSSVQVFECLMYVMYNSYERTKLDSKSRKCIFLGHANNVKGFLHLNPIARKVVVSRDVLFTENKLRNEQKNDNISKETTKIKEKSKESDPSKAESEHEDQVLDKVNDGFRQ